MIDTTRDSAAPSVCLITMGCAKNEVDSAAMARRLREAGFSVTEEASSADAIIVNTCSFIQSATEESIEAVFDAAGMPNVAAGAPLIMAGCMPVFRLPLITLTVFMSINAVTAFLFCVASSVLMYLGKRAMQTRKQARKARKKKIVA